MNGFGEGRQVGLTWQRRSKRLRLRKGGEKGCCSFFPCLLT